MWSTVVAVGSSAGRAGRWTPHDARDRRNARRHRRRGAVMRQELRALCERAGAPTAARLQEHADRRGHSVGRATLAAAVSPTGSGGLKWSTVAAVIDACDSYAKARGKPLPAETVDMLTWRTRYDAAYPGTRTDGEKNGREFTAARVAYLTRLQQKYTRIDTETLLPLTDPDEHPPVGLREVFVAQDVRADPPPVELPRELWQRLADADEFDDADLPDGVDRDTLAKIRHRFMIIICPTAR